MARARAASRDLVPGLALLVATQGSLLFFDPDARASGLHLAWAMSPLVAIGLLAWGQVRALRRCDELQRLMQLTAMAVGFGAFAVCSAVVGVLQGGGIGDPVQQTQLVFFVGVMAWVVAQVAAERWSG